MAEYREIPYANGQRVAKTLELADSIAKEWSRSPFGIKAARRIATNYNATTPEQRALAVQGWIAGRVKYWPDPHGVEMLGDPFHTLANGGDCDDMTALAGALLGALGHDTSPAAVTWEGRKAPSHAVLIDWTAGRVVDPVANVESWPPRGYKVKAITYRRNGTEATLDGFSIKSITKAFKKIHTNIGKALGIDKIKPLAKLDKAITGQLDKVERSVNKDFQKAKVWTQKHRRELYTVAAVAAVAVGGYYAWSAYTAKAAAAAKLAAGATAATTTGAATVGAATVGATGAATAAATSAGWAGTLAAVGKGIITSGLANTVVQAMLMRQAAGEATPADESFLAQLPPDYSAQLAMAPGSYGGGGGATIPGTDEMPEATVEVTDTLPQSSNLPLFLALGLGLFLLVKK